MTTLAAAKGATMGQNVIGEVTESIHKFLIDTYDGLALNQYKASAYSGFFHLLAMKAARST